MCSRAFVCLVCVLAVLCFGVESGAAQAGLTPETLRCEYQTDPLGIGEQRPRLSWTVTSLQRGQKQTAYHILAASSRTLLDQNKGDLWDTGKVSSSQTLGIEYGGTPLRSQMQCFWKVRVWDKDGQVSVWSTPAKWETALLNPQDWTGRWINDGKANPEKEEDFYTFDPAPLFRKEFRLAKPLRQARLYITGLGYYEARLNGQRVGDHVLDPGWTHYGKRVYYSTYDVTGRLQDGANSLGVMVGNGWYNPVPLKMWGYLNIREHLPFGRPRFIAQLVLAYADGTTESVVSDESWKTTEGPILRNNIYLGEVYDARREIAGWDEAGYDDSKWRAASAAKEEIGLLEAQPVPPIKVTATLKPVKITETKTGVYIIDMGQNFAGWARFTFNEKAGTQIRMRYGELLYPDGSLNPMTSVCGQVKGARKDDASLEGAPGLAWQEDVYIAKGSGPEVYQPRFTFHGFRYIEVTGLASKPALDSVSGLRLNTAVQEAGRFSCSNEQFNAIQKMCQWTFLSNIFSVQSDCPHRERFGYGGDLVNTNETFIFNYDMAAFYSKAVRDWQDAALADGMLTDTAPFVGIQYCGVAWAMAHPQTQLQLYRYYGDRRIIEQQYKTSRRWLDIVAAATKDGIIKDGLSDHEGLEENPPESMVTPLYCESARIVSELATLLGQKEDAERYQKLADEIRQAYQALCVDKDSGKCGPGSQTAQTLALSFEMLPDATRPKAFDYLMQQIVEVRKMHLSTGIFGTRYLPDLLCREGKVQTAYDLVNQKTFPSWGHMLETGATTLWEHWEFSDNTFSHNHPMFGSVSQWFYNWLGGIQPDPKANGFNEMILRPQIAGDLKWVKCSYDSVRGTIRSDWERSGNTVTLTIEIPANTTALLYLPGGRPERITENDVPAGQSTGLTYVGVKDSAVIYRAVSGQYRFVVEL